MLAKKVINKQTKGYKHHPQLIRFLSHKNPNEAINYYLCAIYKESTKRGYNFNKQKFKFIRKTIPIITTDKQIEYEWKHFKKKLQRRNKKWLIHISNVKKPEPHPIFKIQKGKIEKWEHPYFLK